MGLGVFHRRFGSFITRDARGFSAANLRAAEKPNDSIPRRCDGGIWRVAAFRGVADGHDGRRLPHPARRLLTTLPPPSRFPSLPTRVGLVVLAL